MNKKTIFEKYAVLEAKKKAITEEQKVLRDKIQEDMLKEGETKKETNIGSFTISHRKQWSYPESITNLEEDLKAEKAKAESTGEATFTEKPSLRFTSIKL